MTKTPFTSTVLCNPIPYLAWHYEAERRYRKGERQLCCTNCELWFFPKWEEDRENHKRRCTELKVKAIVDRH